MDVGDDVAAASGDDVILVAGAGGYEITAMVSVADLPDLEVGQAATVLPDGGDSDSVLDGEVVAIGIAATGSGGTTTYPVTIALTEPAADGLRNGGIASVTVTTASASTALAVPTSAVTVAGDSTTVTVYDGTATDEVEVQIGAVGATWTEITDGVEEGQRVVLADLDAPLPGSATDGTNTTTLQGGPPAGVGGSPGG
jgi:hypothetical protein